MLFGKVVKVGKGRQREMKDIIPKRTNKYKREKTTDKQTWTVTNTYTN